ncbi:BREX-1 system phosphatase PglZ type A [Spirulina sp. 06S082]|uniref:BREX-1 system phosphatase PglZ type A n=1 Tax=Spirulina sp. 06S082 TaxID=3110248 RepID=UPI002B216798|nr:BREX-1 system phosphatase PglZ type A [Spirulina sp. 06S082]MEA5471255.1 BREX-1 system phosphatase PglZ type A [Spirulina sp. 06S082]
MSRNFEKPLTDLGKLNPNRIQNNILALFNSETRWHHNSRRVVFWYDPEGQFQDTFNELHLEGIEKYQLSDRPFSTKYHLLIEKPEQRFLLYAPFPEPKPEDNGLLDLQLAGLTFSADRAALIFADLGLKQRSLEQTIRQHLKFFNSKKRGESLYKMGLSPDTDRKGLLLAILSSVVGLKVPDAGLAIRKVLSAGLLESDNDLWQEIDRFDLVEAFWQWTAEHTQFTAKKRSLHKLFEQLLVTHFAKSLHGNVPDSLAPHIIPAGQRAYAFIDQWMRDRIDKDEWKNLSSQIAEELPVLEILQRLSPEIFCEAASFEDIDRVLLRRTVEAIRQREDLTPWRTWLQGRRTLFWFENYRHHYEAIEAAIALFSLKDRYPHGFSGDARELWQSYVGELHQFDRAYRQFIVQSDRAKGDILKKLSEIVENLYSQWYLDRLGEAWDKAMGERWELSGVLSQNQFYHHFVKPVLQKSDREKAFVIISDALRYEVASELQTQIQKELRGTIELKPLFGVLPSVTKLGMAALLPGTKLEWLRDRNDVLRDDLSTQGSFKRELVLNQLSQTAAKVLSAKDLLGMNTDQGREAVQPYRLIYIYHNVIDAIGDKAASEHQVLAACEEAIAELLRLVKRICNSLNGTRVFITADHGFLYQRRPLAEADKRSLPQGEAVLETHRRYVLIDPLQESHLPSDEGTHCYNLPYLSSNPVALVPRGNLRFALQGAGSQFVHGGASLQETCVPVLAYRHQRSTQTEEGRIQKVGVQVNVRVRRVTNNRFNLTLVQTEAVTGRWRARAVSVGLYTLETFDPITDIPTLELASDRPQPSDREQKIRLTIISTNPPTKGLLIVKDTDDDSELLRETWTINLGIVNDFGDF